MQKWDKAVLDKRQRRRNRAGLGGPGQVAGVQEQAGAAELHERGNGRRRLGPFKDMVRVVFERTALRTSRTQTTKHGLIERCDIAWILSAMVFQVSFISFASSFVICFYIITTAPPSFLDTGHSHTIVHTGSHPRSISSVFAFITRNYSVFRRRKAG